MLVHRIAWLIQVEHASPYSIPSVTFTNKAAAEMRHRIEQLLGINPAGMWVGTFHGLAHRLLRAHWREAGLSENFQILDSDDQQRLVKRVIRELGLDEQRWPARQAQWFINGQKDEGLRPQHIQPGGDLFLATMLKIYEAYEAACARAGVIDFSELLLRALDLWRDHPGVLEHYQRRFRHILVDEFQDTNAVQYAWLRILAKGGDSLMVVGDDDQSIYGWRGARIENIQQFSDDFADAEVIRLEQNYRSTASILKAANALIANNQGRLGKELWTDGEDGESLSLYAAFNEHDEARYVVESIESALKAAWRAARSPSSTAPTPSRGCWRKPCCGRRFPTASTAASASSSVQRSRTPWPTCACSTAAATTRRWNGGQRAGTRHRREDRGEHPRIRPRQRCVDVGGDPPDDRQQGSCPVAPPAP